MQRALRTPKRTGAAKSGADRQAEKGMPSGPGEELLVALMAANTSSREG